MKNKKRILWIALMTVLAVTAFALASCVDDGGTIVVVNEYVSSLEVAVTPDRSWGNESNNPQYTDIKAGERKEFTFLTDFLHREGNGSIIYTVRYKFRQPYTEIKLTVFVTNSETVTVTVNSDSTYTVTY